MCTFCVEIQKQKMTIKEVARAYREFEVPENHNGDIMAVIDDNYSLDDIAKELNELFLEELAKEITDAD